MYIHMGVWHQLRSSTRPVPRVSRRFEEKESGGMNVLHNIAARGDAMFVEIWRLIHDRIIELGGNEATALDFLNVLSLIHI